MRAPRRRTRTASAAQDQRRTSRYGPGVADDEAGARARRARGPALQPRQGAVRRARRDQARPRRLLPARERAAAADDGRPPGAHAALPPRRRGTVVLPEAGSQERARMAADDDGDDGQRHAVARAGDRRSRARRVGGQPRLPGLPRLAIPRRGPRALRRAAPGSRPPAGHRLLGHPPRRRGAQDAARRGRRRRLPEDHRQPWPARLRPARAALGLLCGALSRGGGGARARAPPPGRRHGGMVEGGARRADLRRLQPERPAQDGLRRVGCARPAGRPGVRAAALGGGLRAAPGRADAGDGPRPAGATRRSVAGHRRRPRSRSSRCSRCTSATARTACSTRRGRRSIRRCPTSRRGSRRAERRKHDSA